MASKNDKSESELGQRQCLRLRKIGAAILILGLISAGLLYWIRARSTDVNEDLAMVGYNRAQTQQMGVLFGKSGLLIDNLAASLKRPGIQAVWIAGISVVSALIFFYLGRPLVENENFSTASGCDRGEGQPDAE